MNSQKVSLVPVKSLTFFSIKTSGSSWFIPHGFFISTQACNTMARVGCYLFLSLLWPYSELQYLFSPLQSLCSFFFLFPSFPWVLTVVCIVLVERGEFSSLCCFLSFFTRLITAESQGICHGAIIPWSKKSKHSWQCSLHSLCMQPHRVHVHGPHVHVCPSLLPTALLELVASKVRLRQPLHLLS